MRVMKQIGRANYKDRWCLDLMLIVFRRRTYVFSLNVLKSVLFMGLNTGMRGESY